MEELILSGRLVNALRKGGKYIFVVVRNEKWNRVMMTFVRDGFAQQPEEESKIISKDWILDKTSQRQIVDYMQNNHVISIKFKNEEIWHEDPRVKVLAM